MTCKELGAKVECDVTGFRGTIVSCTTYLDGSIQCGILPQVKGGDTGEYPSICHIDHKRLNIITTAAKNLGF